MTIDVSALANRCAVVPAVSSDAATVRAAVETAGAAVLSDVGTDEASAATLAERVLGVDLRASGRPILVTDGGGLDRRRFADAARRLTPLHTDGYGYGSLAPDVFFLLCVTTSANDGASFLVDQAALLEELAQDPHGRELVDFARTHVVDQSEPGAIPTLGPLALPLPSGATAIRRSLDVRATDDDPDPAHTSRMLTLWAGLLDAVGALAPRFRLEVGQALAIDNTRLAHGRDAYTTPGRAMWRCWAWTTRAGGHPDGELWSDTRALLAHA